MIAMPRQRDNAISGAEDARALALLTNFVSKRTKRDELRSFLKHFFTKSERALLVRRLEVAARLTAGQSYRMIQDALRVSPNLIRRVDQWLSAERPGYRRLISLRHRPRLRRTGRCGIERSADPASFDAFLKRFPLWRDL